MKNNIIFIPLLFLVNIICTSGQEWVWSNNLQCNGNVLPYSIISDNLNNVYLAGYYDNSILQIGNDTINNFGDWDGFICKLDDSGNVQWLRRIAGSGRDEAVSLVIVGSNLYVAGNFRSSILYFTGTDFIVNSDHYDSYIATYDLDGNFIEGNRIFWGIGVDRIRDMKYDSDLNMLAITGVFRDEINYNDISGPVNIPVKGAKDMFVALSDFSGEIQDTAFYEFTSQNSNIKNINLAQNEGYYLSGDLRGTIYFTENDSLTGDNVNMDVMFFKVDKNLDYQFSRLGGGIGFDHANSAVSDKYGNLYLTGKIETNVTFDSTETLKSHTISSFGAQDMFLAKYNKQGTLQWIIRKGDSGNDDGFGLVQRENLVQFCGNFAGTVIFNKDTLKSTSTADINTGFAIFNIDGNEIGAQGIGGTDEDRGEAITFTPSGNTVISGYFASSSISIGDSVFSNLSGTNDGFMGEYYYPLNAVFTRIDNVSCYGGNDGNLITTPYFGIGPYTYEWSPNITSSNDSLAFNLAAGLYSVTITDSRDSTASNSIQITEPLPISIILDSTNLSCFESGDGAIDITVTGGTVAGDYKYNWTGGTGLNPTGSDQSDLFAGIYNVTVTDDNNCQEFASTTIIQPEPITFSGSIVSPSIPSGSCSGSIDLEVQGGTPGYSYEWTKGGTPMPGRTSDTLNNLCGDSYTVIVTDDNMCSNDTTLVVTDEDELIIFIDSLVHVTCYGYNNGYARVGISGDKGIDFSYNWVDSTGSPAGADTNYITNKSGGTYYVTVTENGGDNRMDSISVTIQEPSQLISDIASTDPLCFGDANGIINLSVSGGKPSYAYNWSTGQTTEDLINVPGSTEYYKVTIADKNDCQVLDSVLLQDPEQLNVSISILQEIRCYGYTTGILRAEVTGGTGSVDYLWSDPGNQTNQIASGLDANIYTVTVTDDNNCQGTANSELINPNTITIASVDSSHVSCKGLSDGSIMITAAGGTSPYTYNWDRIPVDTNYVTGLSAAFGGVYSVQVSDINNCPPAYFEMQIKEPDIALNITENAGSHVDNACYGGSIGELGVNASGGWGDYEYSLYGVDWGATTTYTELASESYYIKVRDSGECHDSVLISISQPDEINITEIAASHQNALCYGENTGQIEVLADGGTPDYEYSINKTSWSTNTLFENLYAASHIIWVRDANDCIDSATFLLTQPEMLVIDPYVSEDTINVIATGGTPPLFYSLNSGSLQFTSLFTGLAEGEYSIMVIDGNNCSADTSVTIGVEPPGTEIIIYDAFSPNADGKNDVWNIGNIQSYPNCVVKVFNSWGMAVFNSKGYAEPWDGKHNGNDLPSGTYYYYIDLGDGNGTFTGTVNIVK